MGLFSVRAQTPHESLLRLVGLLLVAGVVALGFWKHNQDTITLLNTGSALSDEAHGLTREQAEQVRGAMARLKADYGLAVRVRIAAALPEAPPADGKTLFLGLGVDEKRAVVRLPALVAGALGPDFARQLEAEHFPFHFAPGRSWQKGLLLALELIETRLAALSAAQQNPPQGGKDAK